MIAFDLDDTLYKECDYVRSGTDAVMRLLRQSHPHLNMPQLAEIKWTETELAAYRNHQPSIKLADATIDTLEHANKQGIRLAIVTDGRSVQQRNKFRALGLNRFVDKDDLLISSEIGGDKTTPIAFEMLMRKYPNESKWMYIGDNPSKDFLHPNRLGWITVMLRDTAGVNIHSQSIDLPGLEYKPKHIVDCLTEALSIYLGSQAYQ